MTDRGDAGDVEPAKDPGDSGLVIVAVNPRGSDLEGLLSGAQKVVIDATTKGDLEAAYDDAAKKAGA